MSSQSHTDAPHTLGNTALAPEIAQAGDDLQGLTVTVGGDLRRALKPGEHDAYATASKGHGLGVYYLPNGFGSIKKVRCKHSQE